MMYIRNDELLGITAARLKRMQAIRKKLKRINLHLNQIQDLGGCRAILDSMTDVRTLVQAVRDRSRHNLRPEKDYIAAPKADGYRSHHLIVCFCGKGPAAVHNDRRIEIQVRTRLQHSWATAVEAVGLFRGEYLKGSQGDRRWRRPPSQKSPFIPGALIPRAPRRHGCVSARLHSCRGTTCASIHGSNLSVFSRASPPA
jgi:hypothetical protein